MSPLSLLAQGADVALSGDISALVSLLRATPKMALKRDDNEDRDSYRL
jgi:hypothetical protein